MVARDRKKIMEENFSKISIKNNFLVSEIDETKYI